MKPVLCLLTIAILSLPVLADEREDERLQKSGEVLKQILDIPDNLPQELLDSAECVIVLPSVKKFAIGLGGSVGKGAMTCRSGANFTGGWSAPAMFRLEGINIGIQLGGQATDFVLLVMNPKGVNALLGSKVKLGADMAAAAGPKGRTLTAATDAQMKAEILAYSRSRGLFAGISLEGSTLRQDNGANKKLYGREIKAREIVRQGKAGVPAAGRTLVSVLSSRTPRNLSDPKSLQRSASR